MRTMLGIAIALPIAAAFCLAYLAILALETVRDATRAHRRASSLSPQGAHWTGPARMTA
jgi:hypothetical protein